MKEKSKCATCIYRQKFGVGNDYWACLYILDNGKPRPCEAGTKCTEYKKGKMKQRIEAVPLPGCNKRRKNYKKGNEENE